MWVLSVGLEGLLEEGMAPPLVFLLQKFHTPKFKLQLGQPEAWKQGMWIFAVQWKSSFWRSLPCRTTCVPNRFCHFCLTDTIPIITHYSQ